MHRPVQATKITLGNILIMCGKIFLISNLGCLGAIKTYWLKPAFYIINI